MEYTPGPWKGKPAVTQVEIFYPSLTYTIVEEEKARTTADLVVGIGGSLNFWLGYLSSSNQSLTLC